MSSDNYYYIGFNGEQFLAYHAFTSDEVSPVQIYEDMKHEPLKFNGVSGLHSFLKDPDNYTEYPAVYSEAAQAQLLKKILRE